MARIVRETVSEMALSALRGDILERRVAPGQPLREETVAKEMGVSRPTIREVFKTLEAQGLLSRNPSTRGLEVANVDADDVREIYHARRHLELAGVRAAQHATPQELAALTAILDEMESAVASGDPLGLVDADTRCHQAIVGFLRSRYLSQLHTTMLTRLRLAMSRVEQDEHRDNSAVYLTHREFCDLLLAGDYDGAADNLEHRLVVSENLILQQEGTPEVQASTG